ncbi:MAG: BMP family ABC transporter substrate-binding protein [Spirochaetaceae bacterium]|nr:BMP family ABC transporter substrate-binding protein [Spirochaetaceae bacterium]
MKFHLLAIAAVSLLVFPSCGGETAWKPGTPLAKEKIKIGVVHITDPFSESGGYAYAHQMGIEEMKQTLSLEDSQILYKTHVDDVDFIGIESAMRELIAQGATIICATSWGYMDTCEKLAGEFPAVVFAHASGYKHNDTNFTNYFGRVYQACYLSGIAAGMKTKSGKIGFVAAWGKENSEVSGNLNAFALGVEKVNPKARIYVKITHSWFDPMGEAVAARSLIAAGCDIIAQHCDTPIPQLEVKKAADRGTGVWGVGYNTDMYEIAPETVLTSVIWRWGAYYTCFTQSIVNGTFNTSPYFGSMMDGIVDITPLNSTVNWDPDHLQLLKDERTRIDSGSFGIFGENISDDEIRSGMNWYYRTIIEL